MYEFRVLRDGAKRLLFSNDDPFGIRIWSIEIYEGYGPINIVAGTNGLLVSQLARVSGA